MNTKITIGIILGGLLVPLGCREDEATAPATQNAATPQAAAPTNRIDVPEAVRQNLGITFAKVEQRRVASVLRVPGRFELLPTARREYRASLPGFVRLLVAQYEQIDKDKPIFQMDSPEWHVLKRELHEAEVGIERASAELTVAQRAKVEAEQLAALTQKRIDALAGAEVRRAELETDVATRRAAIPRLEAEIAVKEVALDEAKHDLELNLNKAASVLGLDVGFLREKQKDQEGHEAERWYSIDHVSATARDAGIVESLGVSDGTWVEANTLVATSVNPAALRFRAVGLQSDLAKLRDGLSVRIVPALSDGISANEHMTATLTIGMNADPDRRTVDLLATLPDGQRPGWARAGVSAFLEIALDESAENELAIPSASIVQDELNFIFFRRDPNSPDKVIRMEADLGPSDGRWVAIRSGVKEGDEVVLTGAYDLNLLGGGKTRGEGGHFHPDGSYHAGPD